MKRNMICRAICALIAINVCGSSMPVYAYNSDIVTEDSITGLDVNNIGLEHVDSTEDLETDEEEPLDGNKENDEKSNELEDGTIPDLQDIQRNIDDETIADSLDIQENIDDVIEEDDVEEIIIKDEMLLGASSNSGECGEGVIWEYDGETLTVSGTGIMTSTPWRSISLPIRGNAKSIVIEGGVNNIMSGAFKDFDALLTIEIKDGVKKIEQSAFDSCDLLSTLTIPTSVTDMGEYAFRSCPELTLIHITGEGSTWTNNLNGPFNKTTNVKTVILDEGITELGDYVFNGFVNLKNISLPESIEKIGGGAFRGCVSLEEITLPDNVDVGYQAFYGCTGLKKVHGTCKMNFYNYLFEGCSSLLSAGPVGSGCDVEYMWDDNTVSYYFLDAQCLESITLPSDTETIGAQLFSGCSSLNEIKGLDNVTGIGSQAFYGCISLTSFTVPEGVTEIGIKAFEDCSELEYIVLPEGITRMSTPFVGCVKLLTAGPYGGGYNIEYKWTSEIPHNTFSSSCVESVVISESITTFRGAAFSSCANLERIYIPKSVETVYSSGLESCSKLCTVGPYGGDYNIQIGWDTKIPDKAFYNNTVLTSVTIPEGITEVGSEAFSGCTSVQQFIIPESTTTFGTDTFKDCTQIKSAGPIGGDYDYQFGWTQSIPASGLSIKTLEEVVLPSSISSIGNSAFYGCSNLPSISLPSDLESIGHGAFAGCSSLSSLNLPIGITSIGRSAFLGCSNISRVTLPSGLTSIGGSAFMNCTNLEYVSIPETLSQVESKVFEGCEKLVSVGPVGGGYSIEYAWTGILPDNAFAENQNIQSAVISNGIHTVGNNAFYSCSGLSEVEFSNTVTHIGDYAFGLCAIEEISLPKSLSSIGKYAFYICSSLSKVDMPSVLDQLDEGAFGACYSLQSIEIPLGITQIPQKAFWRCNSIKSVYIPASVTYIQDDAFLDCSSLREVFYGGTQSEWEDIIIGTNNTYLSNAVIQYEYGTNEYYTVYYESFGKKLDTSTSVRYRCKYGELPEPEERVGYEFIGWYTEKDGGLRVTSDSIVEVIQDHTLYAHWNGHEYIVSFNANGGVVDVDSINVIFGDEYAVLPIPVLEGKYFAGWFTEREGGQLITNETVVNMASDHVLYAYWTDARPTGVSLNYDVVSLNVGEKKTLVAEVYPVNVDNPVFWITSNEAIVQVSNGVITAVSSGKAIISARTVDGMNVAFCEVTVVNSDVISDPAVSELFAAPEGLWTTGIEESYAYTGTKITPIPKVYYGNTLLRNGSEYAVSFKNNVNAGTAIITITGKGNYSGKCTKTFTITPLELQDNDIDVASGVENKNKAVKPVVVVIHNGIQLKEKKDYVLSYEPIYAVGSTAVSITGIGNYTGIIKKDFVVRAKGTASIKSATLVGLKKSYTLTEMENLIENSSSLAVKIGKKEVNPGDYTFKFENCNKVGKGTIVIQPSDTGIYVGEKRVSVTITGTKLGSVILSPGVTYNGKVQEPSVSVYTGTKGTGNEISSDCYNVSYNVSPTNAATVTVFVTANAEMGYTGKLTAKYKISPLSINDEGITVSVPDDIYYSQGGVKPSPLVNYTNGENTWTLREGFDYTVSYANNTAVGGKKVPTFTITGKGNFTGKRAAQVFAISKRNISSLSMACTNVVANDKKKGTYYYSKPVIYDVNGKTLKENTDYTVTYTNLLTGQAIGKQDVLPVGTTIRANIVAKEKNYTGSAQIDYEVVASVKNVNAVKAGKIANQYYTGRAIELDYIPLTFVSGSGKTRVETALVEGDDYVVTSYYNNVKKGTASLRIEGRGEYTGSKIISFKIVAANNFNAWLGTYKNGELVGFAATSVTMQDENVIIGGKVTMSPIYGPKKCDIPEVTWKSSNTKVATVDKHGNVTGKSKGTARITITSNANKAVTTSSLVTVD